MSLFLIFVGNSSLRSTENLSASTQESSGETANGDLRHSFLPLSDLNSHHFTTDQFNTGLKLRNPREIPGDLYRAGRIFVGDFAYVYSAPARIDAKSILWTGIFGVTAGLLYLHDRDVLKMVQRNSHIPVFGHLLRLGYYFEPMGHMGVMNKYYFAGLGVGYLFHINPLTTITSQVLESFFIAGAFKNLAGYLIGRSRPFEQEGPYSFGFNEGTSFPSGHALNIFQMAVVLSHNIRFLPFQIFSYCVATGVALQRVDSNNHWPSDVFFGAVLGIMVSRTVVRLNEQRKISLHPTIMHPGNIPGISMSFRIQ